MWIRLRLAGIRTSRPWVLRLMREHTLLAPLRVDLSIGSRNYHGIVIPDTLDTMWCTDMTSTWTAEG